MLQHLNVCHMKKHACKVARGKAKPKTIEVVHNGPCVHPKTDCDFASGRKCQCPSGSTGANCEECLPGFWAYTSFGCNGRIKKRLPGNFWN